MSLNKKPSFSESLKPAEICAGDRHRFECKVEGRPKPTVVWNKDGKVVIASNRIRIMEVYGTHSLVVSRADSNDTGVYSATATNHLGSESCTANLNVTADDPGSRRSSALSHSSSSASDRSASGGSSASSVSPKLGRAAASRLVTSNVWTTKVMNQSSNQPPRRRAPGFILRPRPQAVENGGSLCLKCTLLGHPKPTVTWEKNGDLVDEDRTEGHIQTRIDGNNYFLEISKCGCEDAGKYTVTAKNSLGKQTASVEVTVTGSDAASSKPAEVGSSTTTTKMNGSLPNKSNHINNNNTNNNNHSKIERKPSVKELILPANPVDRKDSVSSPTESVSSTISNHSRASSVHTQGDGDDTKPTNGRRSTCVAPTFTSRLSSTQVLEGEELLLQCEVSGDPDPEMVWLRNGEELAVNKNEAFISCRNGMARLRLRDVQTRHAGEYVCQASNDGGMVKCSSRVTVKAKPSYKRPCFITPPKDVRGYEGDTLALETEVDGQPTPEIVWSLDGEEVADAECSYVGNIAKLVLRNVTSSHSGQYMCSAINS